MHSTPQLSHFMQVPSRTCVKLAPGPSCFQGRQALYPLPQPAVGVIILEPLWERPAGYQNSLAPSSWRLGRSVASVKK